MVCVTSHNTASPGHDHTSPIHTQCELWCLFWQVWVTFSWGTHEPYNRNSQEPSIFHGCFSSIVGGLISWPHSSCVLLLIGEWEQANLVVLLAQSGKATYHNALRVSNKKFCITVSRFCVRVLVLTHLYLQSVFSLLCCSAGSTTAFCATASMFACLHVVGPFTHFTY